jgi:Holliday junction resolvasome RuvABC endonuclease subunit
MDWVKVVAFDPSLINLGFACGISTPDGLVIDVAQTFKIDQLITKHGGGRNWDMSDNLVRMQWAIKVVEYCMEHYAPDVVVLEDPIFNKRNPDSLIVQSRGLGIIESAIAKYYLSQGLTPNQTNYKPNVIKQGVGVEKGRYNDKQAITDALNDLMSTEQLRYVNEAFEPNKVDDHTNDAVAMVYNKHVEIQYGMVQ